jgi:hypothetical protein
MTRILIAAVAALTLIAAAPAAAAEDETIHQIEQLQETGAMLMAFGTARSARLSAWNSSLDITLNTRNADGAERLGSTLCHKWFGFKSGHWKIRMYLIDGSIASECKIETNRDPIVFKPFEEDKSLHTRGMDACLNGTGTCDFPAGSWTKCIYAGNACGATPEDNENHNRDIEMIGGDAWDKEGDLLGDAASLAAARGEALAAVGGIFHGGIDFLVSDAAAAPRLLAKYCNGFFKLRGRGWKIRIHLDDRLISSCSINAPDQAPDDPMARALEQKAQELRERDLR